MKKFSFLLGSLILSSSYATTLTIDKESESYLNLYANELIKEFDKDLDRSLITNEDPLEASSYAKLQVIREMKEKNHLTSSQSIPLPMLNKLKYMFLKDSIDKQAKQYADTRKFVKENLSIDTNEIEAPYKYPSTGEKGNIFGNNYPRGVWSVTYDDGPRNDKTPLIIDDLQARNVKGMFFMLAQDALRHDKAAREVRDRGQDVALHSWSHQNLPKVSDATLQKEITYAKESLENQLSVDVKYFRLPFGAGVRDPRIRKVIADNNMISVFWNVDTLDWQDKNPESVLQRSIKQIKASRNDGGIILFHDIHATTRKASQLVLDYLIENRYSLCSVSDVVDYMNGEDQDCL